MLKLSLLIILFVEVVFGKVAFNESSNTSKFIYDIEAHIELLSLFGKNDTEVGGILPLIVKYNSDRTKITYRAGERTSGDELVAQGSKLYTYSSATNIRLKLEYPLPGNDGAKVTYVEVIVQQSSDVGEGYIVDGGIGMRYIKLYIDVYETTYLEFSASVYGIY